MIYLKTSGLTQLGGNSPLRPAIILSAAIIAIFVRLSVVAEAECG
jgi:hypothetical protein